MNALRHWPGSFYRIEVASINSDQTQLQSRFPHNKIKGESDFNFKGGGQSQPLFATFLASEKAKDKLDCASNAQWVQAMHSGCK